MSAARLPFRKGQRVRTSGGGRTSTWPPSEGTVLNVRRGRVYVRWDGTHFSDEMRPEEVVRVVGAPLAANVEEPAFVLAPRDRRREVLEGLERLGFEVEAVGRGLVAVKGDATFEVDDDGSPSIVFDGFISGHLAADRSTPAEQLLEEVQIELDRWAAERGAES